MAALHSSRFLYLSLFLTSVTSNFAIRPVYTEYGLDNEKICHPLRRRIELKEDLGSAIIIRPNHKFDIRNTLFDTECKFIIETKKGNGLFAVINTMSFRRNGTECLDYVKFKKSDEWVAGPFCGVVDRTKVRNSEIAKSPTSSPTFDEYDLHGKIETTIFISKTPLQGYEKLDLTITYTPYKDCRNGILPDYHLASENSSFMICMWKEYFCDTHQNCATSVCEDEKNCPGQKNIISNETGNKVTVGAVTTIVLGFIIFVLCLWICRKHRKLCWAPDCAGPTFDINLTMHRNVASQPTSHLNPPYISTAPMLEVAVPSSLHDKDLPPSYDSLFPSQANTTTST